MTRGTLVRIVAPSRSFPRTRMPSTRIGWYGIVHRGARWNPVVYLPQNFDCKFKGGLPPFMTVPKEQLEKIDKLPAWFVKRYEIRKN